MALLWALLDPVPRGICTNPYIVPEDQGIHLYGVLLDRSAYPELNQPMPACCFALQRLGLSDPRHHVVERLKAFADIASISSKHLGNTEDVSSIFLQVK